MNRATSLWVLSLLCLTAFYCPAAARPMVMTQQLSDSPMVVVTSVPATSNLPWAMPPTGSVEIVRASTILTHYVAWNGTNPVLPYLSWETAATNIQDAISASGPGDVVIVTNGSYLLTETVTVPSGIVLRGWGAAGDTILDARGSRRCVQLGAYAALENLTVLGGWARGLAGGVYAEEGASIRYCAVVGNQVAGEEGVDRTDAVGGAGGASMGGGVFFASRGVLEDSLIAWNSACGGRGGNSEGADGGNGGNAEGAGIHAASGFVTVARCIIGNNAASGGHGGYGGRGCGGNGGSSRGAGVFLAEGVIRQCRLSGNIASGAGRGGGYFGIECQGVGGNSRGGAVYAGPGARVLNCLVYRNEALPGAGGFGPRSEGQGGGLYAEDGAVMLNCTIVSNNTVSFNGYGHGGGMYLAAGGTSINNIVWGNEAHAWADCDGPGLYAHCCSGALLDGTGNITNDPLFVAAGDGDYRLAGSGPVSPCIDAGLDLRSEGIISDLNGVPRPLDGDGDGTAAADIGAYEYLGQATATVTVTLQDLSQVYDGAAKCATATTVPPGLAVTFTYDGSVIAPIHAGTYTVVGTVNDVLDGMLYWGSATGTLVVSKADQQIVFPPITPQKTSASVGLAATGGGSGNPVVFAVGSGPGVIADSTNLTFTAEGNVEVMASQAVSGDYNAAAVTNVVRAFSVTPDSGPFVGARTTAVAGDFGTVTNVLVGGLAMGFVSSSDGFTLTLPAPVSPGAVDIVVQTADGDIVLAAAYAYNPQGVICDTSMVCGWEEIAGLPIAVNILGAGALHGSLYAVCGCTGDIEWGPSVTNAYRFDGTSWTAAPGLPWAVQHFASAVCGDALYALGGCGSSNAYRFDGTNWAQIASLPMILMDGAAVAWNGSLYHIGGYTDFVIHDLEHGTSTAPMGPKTNVYCYNGTTWTEVRGLPAERHQLTAAVLDGKLYAIGGAGSTNVYRYDGTNWTEVAGLPAIMEYARSEVLNGRLYLWGGAEGQAAKNDVFQFDGIRWTTAPELPDARFGAGGCVFNGALYSVAGRGTGPTTNVYRSVACTDGVEPMFCAWTGGCEVIIRGFNLGDGSDVTNVTLCGAGVVSIVSQSATQVVVVAGPAVALGLGDVRVFSTSFGETVKSNVFTVLKGNQTITFPVIPPQHLKSRLGLMASASSGLPVSFAVLSGPAVLANGTNLTFTASDRVTVRASQPGDANWNPAPDVVREFQVLGGLTTDYDGDGDSDLAVYDPVTGNWYVLPLVGDVVLWAQNWGYAGAIPAPGDYSGDGVSDLAVYNPATGDWHILSIGNQVLAWYMNWGFPGTVAVSGDYDGDAISDLAVYDPATGNWYIRTIAGKVLAFSLNWGFPGTVAVSGDYDGDGVSDLAVYDETAGNWFIRRLTGKVLAFDLDWGFNGAIPVSGDYNGDGASDLAVYDLTMGDWFIRTLGGEVLAWGVNWGYPGAVPVPGDYDGDGVSDLAVYDEAAGDWYIRTLRGKVLKWDLNWGAPDVEPVD